MRIPIASHLLATVLFCNTIADISGTVQSDPCLDGVKLDTSSLYLPSAYANMTPPWQRADGSMAQVTRSTGFSFQWTWMKSLRVKGLNIMVEDLMAFLFDSECLFIPIGPAVRVAILGQRPVYLSGEVSCELHDLYEKCVSKYGASVCSLYPMEDDGWGAYRLEIGDASSNHSTEKMKAEPIVLHEWRSMLGKAPEKWRFTVDTMAMYDDLAGNMFVIDPLGKGYINSCEKELVPASDDWKHWSQEQSLKIMGFYELRTEGFSAKTDSLSKFIKKEINGIDKRVAQKFYCENILSGVANLEGSTPVCHTKYPDKEAADKIADVRKIMIHELGDVWNSSIGKAADELEAVFCTDRQFVEIRSRLLHKVPSRHDDQWVPEEPKIIEDGRPMINDSSQIHARPILHMAAEPPILPPDYPNSPHAQPNEHLEIVTPTPLLVEGGGMDPIAIQVNTNRVLDPIDDDSEDQEEYIEATRQEIGTPAEPDIGIDYSHHNSANNNIPVMRFDKVEESGLSDVSASAMEVASSDSTSSRTGINLLTTFSIFFSFLLYIC
ncbi:hypothetical protein GCK72_005841 [Caenorhabditis remanei]|uniref:Uncharacterized protein n=1 Tax=Caenorhabditis remanei TaxID=31234 RepID=A0A6A5HDQ2_CAERE|nr:hypothetical protein GCK72_005841 [Caenorhabditis remanei]KAF1765888.1 hypothetical protein GCK72_005841 [Caenorhabditis remanei]